MLTPTQIRGARAMLNMTQSGLAERAGISATALNSIERGSSDPKASTLKSLQTALEAAGCIFIAENGEGPGVRLRKNLEAHSAHAISAQIETLEATIADMPAEGEPSPENGMNTMRKAVAENDLAHLKGRRRKAERE